MFAVLVAVASCGILEPDDHVCTQAGCIGGLTVQLASMPAGPYRVELTFAGLDPDGPSYVYECDGGPLCRRTILFPEIYVTHLSVRVTTSAGTRSTEFPDIHFDERFPNGRSCPPRCLTATIIAPLPSDP